MAPCRTASVSPAIVPGRRSLCEPYLDAITEKLKQELTAQRIYQDLVNEHQFADSYQSVKRFVRRLEAKSGLPPPRRMECAPGFEAQVDYGMGTRVIDAEGKLLDRWKQSIADTRIHGTTRQHVGQLFVEVEQPALRPLPLERFPFFHEAQRKVSRGGHIEVARAYYSIPPEYLGHMLWVRWDARL